MRAIEVETETEGWVDLSFFRSQFASLRLACRTQNSEIRSALDAAGVHSDASHEQPLAHAANWQLLGLTTGRGKNDQTNKPNRPIKEILGLPLTARFRKYLTQL